VNGPNLIAINVGNTRTQLGQFIDGELEQNERFDNDQRAEIVQTVLKWWQPVASLRQAMILLASARETIARQLSSALRDQLSVEIYEVGNDLPLPISSQLDPETITGVDRLLNAAAAYERTRQACVIVDAGTAVTVDFVDRDGTFHGGAIAPGAALQLRALHEHTDALPELTLRVPDDDAFGRSTAQAMLQGVYQGIRGLVARLVEQYAESYGAYPKIIATGGDAELLFENDELIDNIVPELTLLGMAITAKHAMAVDPD